MISPVRVETRRQWLWPLAVAFCAEGLVLAMYVGPRSHAIDFYHVNFVPSAVRSGFNVYDAAEHPTIATWIDNAREVDGSKRLGGCLNLNQRLYPTGFCPTATPFLYSLHSLGLIGPFDLRFWIFHLLATALCMFGLFLMGRTCSLDQPTSWLVCGLIMSFCWGLFLDAQLANVTRIQIFGLAVAVAATRSRCKWGIALAGFTLAVGCAYKPTILPSLGFWLFVLAVDRRWRDLLIGFGGLAIGSAISAIFPLVLFDSLDCWSDWKHFASAELSALATSFPGNYSLSSALMARGHQWAAALPWIFGAGLILAFAWTAFPAAQNEDGKDWRDMRLGLAIVVGPLWAILSSPLTWVQYSALAMPLVIVLLGVTSRRKSPSGLWLSLLIASAALSGGMLQRFFAIEDLWLDAGTLWTGWFGLLLASLWLLFSMHQANRQSVKPVTSQPILATRFSRMGLGK